MSKQLRQSAFNQGQSETSYQKWLNYEHGPHAYRRGGGQYHREFAHSQRELEVGAQRAASSSATGKTPRMTYDDTVVQTIVDAVLSKEAGA